MYDERDITGTLVQWSHKQWRYTYLRYYTHKEDLRDDRVLYMNIAYNVRKVSVIFESSTSMYEEQIEVESDPVIKPFVYDT